jgi:hypothetical protein
MSKAWWEYPVVFVALILSVSLPLWFTSLPPLIDLPTHMAGYRVQTDLTDNPLLQRNWAFHWSPIGNLGVELLVGPLAKFVGLERAVWWIVASIPPLLAWGMLRAARLAHGRVPGTALAALPFALAYPYQFGFVNFWLGLALAFHAYVFWPRSSVGRRWLMFIPIGMAVWVCHAFAWGVLGVLVGGWELGEAFTKQGERLPTAVGRIIARCAPLLLPLLPMIYWRAGRGGMATDEWFVWTTKALWITEMLRDQSRLLDVASVLGIAFIIAAVVGLTYIQERRLAFEPHLGFAALALASLYLVVPNQLLGSSYADTRLAPVAMMVTLLSIAPGSGAIERYCAVMMIILLAVRLAVGSAGYAAYDRDFTSHLRALDLITPGARVVALVRSPCEALAPELVSSPGEEPWRLPRDQHLASLAVVRRSAFVNTSWKVSGDELVMPTGALGSSFNADPSQFVSDDDDCPTDLRPRLAQRIAEVPRDIFDYVWVLGFAPASLPRYDGLRPLYADGASVLYAVESKKGHHRPAPRLCSQAHCN